MEMKPTKEQAAAPTKADEKMIELYEKIMEENASLFKRLAEDD